MWGLLHHNYYYSWFWLVESPPHGLGNSDTGTVAMLSSSLSTSHPHSGSSSGCGGADPCLSVNDNDDDDDNNNDNQENDDDNNDSHDDDSEEEVVVVASSTAVDLEVDVFNNIFEHVLAADSFIFKNQQTRKHKIY